MFSVISCCCRHPWCPNTGGTYNRIVHRGRALKEEEIVPDDTVDMGEQDGIDDSGMDRELDLSYLWVVDLRTLRPKEEAVADTTDTKHAIKGIKESDEALSDKQQVKCF